MRNSGNFAAAPIRQFLSDDLGGLWRRPCGIFIAEFCLFTGWKTGSVIYTVTNIYASWSVISSMRKFCHINFSNYLKVQSTKSNCWNIKFLGSVTKKDMQTPPRPSEMTPSFFDCIWCAMFWIERKHE